MAETKQVQEVKVLEEKLAAARETARAAFLQTITDNIEQLKAIGFEYRLEQNGAAGAVRRGRPRKGEQNGQAQQQVG